MKNYIVMEVKTGVVLVQGSYDYCKNWVFKNCTHNEKRDIWADADREEITITSRWKLEVLHNTVIDYGDILQDSDFECVNGCHRVRIIQLEEHIYYDYMHNGRIVECKEIKGEEIKQWQEVV